MNLMSGRSIHFLRKVKITHSKNRKNAATMAKAQAVPVCGAIQKTVAKEK